MKPAIGQGRCMQLIPQQVAPSAVLPAASRLPSFPQNYPLPPISAAALPFTVIASTIFPSVFQFSPVLRARTPGAAGEVHVLPLAWKARAVATPVVFRSDLTQAARARNPARRSHWTFP